MSCDSQTKDHKVNVSSAVISRSCSHFYFQFRQIPHYSVVLLSPSPSPIPSSALITPLCLPLQFFAVLLTPAPPPVIPNSSSPHTNASVTSRLSSVLLTPPPSPPRFRTLRFNSRGNHFASHGSQK